MTTPARTGDPLSIRAEDWNRVRALQLQKTDAAAPAAVPEPAAAVPVYGYAAQNTDELALVAITALSIDPHAAGSYRPEVTFGASAWPDSLGSLGVLMQPLRAGLGGVAAIAGMTVATVNVGSTTDRFASIDPATPAQLKSSDTGEFALLTPGGTGVRRCVVRFLPGPVLWRYKLNAAFATGSALAKLVRMDGTEYAASVTILDPLNLMDDQAIDDPGWCLQVGNKFQAIQAPCA